MTFSFSLCTTLLLAALVTYFRNKLGKLSGLVLGQLDRRTSHVKSSGNPKFIVQEITRLYTHFQKILREQNRDS